MSNPLNGTNLFALLLLLRSGTDQALLVVEGSSDSLTLAPHVDNSRTRLVPGYGRLSVEDAIQLSNGSSLTGVVGLADLDIDYLVGYPTLVIPNLVRTSNYDLESDLLHVEGLVERIIYSNAERNLVDDSLA